MGKISKVIFSIVFIILFVTVGYCIFQINQTQQAVLVLAEQFTGESASGTSGSFTVGYTPASDNGSEPSSSPQKTPTPEERQEASDRLFKHNSIIWEPASSPSLSPTPVPPPATKAPAVVEDEPHGETVYWVPNGKVWHTTPNCSTLSRSSDIRSGTIEESGKSRACKKCG